MARLSFRCDEELLAAVDRARGDVARERWLRRAVEQALGGGAPGGTVEPPAPAEQPEVVRAAVDAIQSQGPAEMPGTTPADSSGCPRHPDAGLTRVKGSPKLWCAEPGCSASFAA